MPREFPVIHSFLSSYECVFRCLRRFRLLCAPFLAQVAERELERLLLEQEKARDPFAATGMKEQCAKKKKKTGKKKQNKGKAKKVVKVDDEDEEGSSSGDEDGDDEAEHDAGAAEVEPGQEVDLNSHEEEAPADNLALVLVSGDSAAAIVTEHTGTGRVWTEACDGEGTPYYYNEEGETVWELPEGDTAVPEEHRPGGLEGDESGGGAEHAWEAGAGELGHGDASAWGTEDCGGESAWEAEEGGGSSWGEEEWEEAYDDQGVAYWYNASTGESAYE